MCICTYYYEVSQLQVELCSEQLLVPGTAYLIRAMVNKLNKAGPDLDAVLFAGGPSLCGPQFLSTPPMASSNTSWMPPLGKYHVAVGSSLGRTLKARNNKGGDVPTPAPSGKRGIPTKDYFSFRC